MSITINTPTALAIMAAAMLTILSMAYGAALDRALENAFIVPCTTDSDCAAKNPHVRF